MTTSVAVLASLMVKPGAGDAPAGDLDGLTSWPGEAPYAKGGSSAGPKKAPVPYLASAWQDAPALEAKSLAKGAGERRVAAPSLAEVGSDLSRVLVDRQLPLMTREGVVPPSVLNEEYLRSTQLPQAVGGSATSRFAREGRTLRFSADRRPENVVGIGVEAGPRNWWTELMGSRVAQLLITEPTVADVEVVSRELGIRVDASLASEMSRTAFDRRLWRPSGEGSQPTHFPWPDAATAIVDVFRVLRAMSFVSPVPILGATNLYSWFVRRGFRVLLILNPNGVSTGVPGWSVAGSHTPPTIRLNVYDLIARPPIPAGEQWDEVGAGRNALYLYVNAIVQFIAHMMHEAGHARGNYPHTCNNQSAYTRHYTQATGGGTWNDLNFAYGGAWAVQQSVVEWMGMTGDFFPPMVRESLQSMRNSIAAVGYCGAI